MLRCFNSLSDIIVSKVGISVNIFHAIIWPKSQLVTEFFTAAFFYFIGKRKKQNKTKQKRSNKHAPNNVHLQEIILRSIPK